MKQIIARNQSVSRSPFPVISGVLLMLVFLMQACLKPLEGDFPIHGQGLADDELLWVLRIPVSPTEADLPNISMRDSIRFADYNRPFFTNAIQQLVKRILNGEVKALDEYPGLTEVENARERLIQMGGTGQNIDPLLKVAELISWSISAMLSTMDDRNT